MEIDELFSSNVDSEKFLYHYTSRGAALGGILPLRHIRASPQAWLNDPLENEPIELMLTFTDAEVFHQERWSPKKIEVQTALDLEKLRTKVMCFTRDSVGTEEHRTIEGRGFGHSAMWTHYGGRNSGVCLVFEKDLLDEEVERSSPRFRRSGNVTYKSIGEGLYDSSEALRRKVIYYERAKVDVGAEVERLLTENLDILFLTKLADWSLEKEYRWVVRTDDLGPAFFEIDRSLTAVVVGSSFPSNELENLRELSSQFDLEVRLAKFKYIDGCPMVEDLS